MKLKSKIFGLFIIFSAVPLIIISIIFGETYSKSLRSVLQNDLDVATNTILCAIQTFLHECDTDVNVIADYADTKRLLHGDPENEQDSRARLEQVLISRVSNNQYLESFSILDENFEVLACTTPVKENEISILRKLEKIENAQDITYTHVSENSGTDKATKTMAVIKPILENQKLTGYVVGQINLDFFEKLRKSAALINDGTIYLTDSEKHLITAGSENITTKNFVSTESERSDYYKKAAKIDPTATEGTFSYTILGKNYMSHFKVIPETNWRLTSTICIDSIVKSQNVFINTIIIVAVTLVVTMLALHYVIGISIVRPIEKMVDTFRRIRSEKNYEIRMDADGATELTVISGEINMLLGQVHEIIVDERSEQQKLKDRASKDLMTNIYNKSALLDIMKSTFKIARATNSPCACMFVDIDDFKDFNTEFGHLIGDNVIKYVANVLVTAQLGDVGRMGGDEFVVCISNENVVLNIETHIKRLLSALNSGMPQENENLPISCSIGVAMMKDDMENVADFIKAADDAMYIIKQNSKNSFIILR